jgi:GNAT superfamily N-acetyltransferase
MHELNISIRKAFQEEHELLSTIALLAKKHWNYTEEYYEAWKDELTITPEYINKNIVFVAVLQDVVVGFYSIVKVPEDFLAGDILVKKGYWLEHIFILPRFHKQGIGNKLIKHAIQIAKEKGITSIKVFVDPFTAGFYNKIGAKQIGNSKSSIKGRIIPVYEIEVY